MVWFICVICFSKGAQAAFSAGGTAAGTFSGNASAA